MDNLQIEALMSALAPVIRSFVESSLAPVTKRLASVESRPPVKGDQGDPGKPGESKEGPAGRGIVEALTDGDGNLILTFSDGTTKTIGRIIGKNGDPGLPGLPGKDADPAALEGLRAEVLQLRSMIAELVAKPALPGPQGDPGKPGAPGESIKGEDGKDGRGLADALIDADGALVLTFTDGSTKTIGRVKGADGKNGDFVKGDPGKDGVDGLGIRDFEVLHDGGRIFTLRWSDGERTEERSFTVPAVLDCGVWVEREYEKGDAVSFAGSIFIAQQKTKTKPETGTEWRLAVKRGRDGKDLRDAGPAKPQEPLRLR